MKFSILLATICTTGLLLPIGQAQADNWTIGGNVGYALGDTNAANINRQLSDLGLDATATSHTESRRSWQVNLGYQYSKKWGVELGYVNLGQVSTTLTGTTADINSFLTSVENIHPQTAQGWQALGSYRHSVDSSSNIVFKAGLLDWTNQYKLETTTVSRTVNNKGVSGLVGLGFETELVPNIMLSTSVSRYRIKGEPVSILDFGVTYRFK